MAANYRSDHPESLAGGRLIDHYLADPLDISQGQSRDRRKSEDCRTRDCRQRSLTKGFATAGTFARSLALSRVWMLLHAAAAVA
jgi:hypothetical protein